LRKRIVSVTWLYIDARFSSPGNHDADAGVRTLRRIATTAPDRDHCGQSDHARVEFRSL